MLSQKIHLVQGITMNYYVLQCIKMHYYVLLCITMYRNVLLCITMYYYVLQCIKLYWQYTLNTLCSQLHHSNIFSDFAQILCTLCLHVTYTLFKKSCSHFIGPPKKDRKQSIKNKNNRYLSFHFDFLGLSVCGFVRLSVFSGFSDVPSRITR